jgi:hypothetical protein
MNGTCINALIKDEEFFYVKPPNIKLLRKQNYERCLYSERTLSVCAGMPRAGARVAPFVTVAGMLVTARCLEGRYDFQLPKVRYDFRLPKVSAHFFSRL